MRIGINTLFLVPGDVGGTEIYLRKNLQEMVKQFQEHIFILFTTIENDDLFRSDLKKFENIEYRQISIKSGNRPVRIIAEQTLLPIHAQRADLDVLWSPGYTAPFFAPCPQVVTIHDLQYLSYPEDLTWMERKTLDFLVRGACRRCSRILTVSQFSKDEVIRHGFAENKKIDVVYEGVDPQFCRSNIKKPKSRRTLVPDDVPYILCVAHTYPHKQVHLLVEAFDLILEQIPHHLVLVGKARRGEAKVQEALKHLKEQSRVHRLFGIGSEDLIDIFHQSELFVFPSIYEGFGLPVLEAMMSEVPVVTTRSAAIPEVGGDSVIYAEEISGSGFAEAILSCLSMEQEWKEQLCKNALERARRFSWEKSAVNTVVAIQRSL